MTTQETMVNVGVRVPRSLRDELRRYQEIEYRSSESEFVRLLLEQMLKLYANGYRLTDQYQRQLLPLVARLVAGFPADPDLREMTLQALKRCEARLGPEGAVGGRQSRGKR